MAPSTNEQLANVGTGTQGGITFSITKWQCHKCRTKTPIPRDREHWWIFGMAEKCANKEECNHARCDECYNLNPRGKIFEHCDGSAVDDKEYLAWCLEDFQDRLVEN